MNQELELKTTEFDELSIIKRDLQLAEHKAEILELKHKLEKMQAEKVSRLEDSLFSANLMPHYKKVAEMLANSGAVPKQYIGKPNDIFVALAMGYKLEFSVEQALQVIAVVNGRPCIWGDGLLAKALADPRCEDIIEVPIIKEGVEIGYKCSVKRKGHTLHTKSFTINDAQAAGLMSKDTYRNYPIRMCQQRARVAIRDKFADALMGLSIREVEEEDENLQKQREQIVEGELIFDKNDKQTDKLKKLLQSSSVPETPKESEAAQSKSKASEEKAEKGPATQEQLIKIEELIKIKDFPESRQKDALAYYKVAEFKDLNSAQADAFLKQLGKC